MSMRAKVAGLTLVATVLLAAPTFAAAKEGPVGDTVATVNGSKITKKDVSEAMQTIPQLKGADAATQAQAYPRIVDQLVTEKLIDDAIHKAKYDNDPEYKKRMEAAKEMVGRQIFIERLLKDKVTESSIKSEYEKFKKENAGKEEIKARQILVATEDEAKQVIKDLDGGEKFEDIAKKRSTGPSAQNGGEIPGYFIKEEMLPEISGAAFGLTSGTYTKTPIKSQFGWHIIKVEDKRQRVVPEEKDVDGAIRSKLGQEALAELAKDLRGKADIKVFDQNGKPAGETKKN
jgi:peptidyl-prolyl cis-trans isomerase C